MADEVVEVTNLNWPEELTFMDYLISDYDYVAFDTEFPDVLRSTPPEVSDDERYADLKSNVDATDFVQLVKLRITCIGGQKGGSSSVRHHCWQFTLEETDSPANPYLIVDNPDECICAGVAGNIISTLKSKNIKWITFHGLYNIAYLLKLVKSGPLPDTLPGFAEAVGRNLGDVYDVKHMSEDLCLGNEIGLAELAKALGVHFDGGERRQQAANDSLLTAEVFAAMRCVYDSRFDSLLTRSRGLVHGMKSARIKRVEETGVRKVYTWGRIGIDLTFFNVHMDREKS